MERVNAGYGYGIGSGIGSGCGNGNGNGSSCGYGSGNGDGYGVGADDGCVYGDGCGYGDGTAPGYGGGDGRCEALGLSCGITKFNRYAVEIIDGVQTIIERQHGRFARGWILNRNLTTSPCCVASNEDGMCAHGATMREAMSALAEKEMESLEPEERVEAFMACHNRDEKYPARDLFEWHHHLTGSCLAGRQAFCHDRAIDIDRDEFTPKQFVDMTRNSYGAHVIELLAERMGLG